LDERAKGQEMKLKILHRPFVGKTKSEIDTFGRPWYVCYETIEQQGRDLKVIWATFVTWFEAVSYALKYRVKDQAARSYGLY
jgi:hypothetical protein